MLHHFDIKQEQHGDTSTLVVEGELDIAATARFRRVVGELMGGGARDITVDLTETEFIDSSGLGALLWAEHRLRAAGGSFGVVNAPERVVRTIALAGLDELLLH